LSQLFSPPQFSPLVFKSFCLSKSEMIVYLSRIVKSQMNFVHEYVPWYMNKYTSCVPAWTLEFFPFQVVVLYSGLSIDYRCYNRRFWLSAHNFQVPTPTSQNLATGTANSDLWSRLTRQLLGGLRFTIPNLKIYLPKKVNSEKLGLGIDNRCTIVFLSLRMNKCLERVNVRHFWNPGVFSYAMIPWCRPNSRVYFSSSHL
jgi:hypothetical protein